ncbi:MAG: cytochrome c peroxidase [Gallionella sp.]
MNKRYIYLLLLVVVSGVAFFYAFTVRQIAPQVAWYPPVEAGNEPITPLPLTLNLDRAKVDLGQRLFNDSRLSGDHSISCATCHNLAHGGMDGLPQSIGIGGAKGGINAPTVFNSGFNFRQFWDGRAATLEDQIDGPVQNPKEMGATWPVVIASLKEDAAYRLDFGSIYPEGINPASVKNAIANFERSLITPNSKFDQFLRGQHESLTSDEFEGYKLFKALGCISCHQGMNVGGNMYEKLGLVDNYFEHRGHIQVVDYGRYNITKNEENRYEFRVPSLRNVALTAPYFHDASARTLEQAVSIMAKYQLGVDLLPNQVAKIVKFLNTLTGEIPKRQAGVAR